MEQPREGVLDRVLVGLLAATCGIGWSMMLVARYLVGINLTSFRYVLFVLLLVLVLPFVSAAQRVRYRAEAIVEAGPEDFLYGPALSDQGRRIVRRLLLIGLPLALLAVGTLAAMSVSAAFWGVNFSLDAIELPLLFCGAPALIVFVAVLVAHGRIPALRRRMDIPLDSGAGRRH